MFKLIQPFPLLVIQIFRFFFVTPLVVLLFFLSSWVRRRVLFEARNRREIGAKSFKKSNLKVEFCFCVSSEGELEQIRVLVDEILRRGGLVEILFSSESVEAKVKALYIKNSNQVRYLRLPLLTFWPFFLSSTCLKNWVSASKVVVVRYDFYPEVLLLASTKTLFLIDGTLKNKNLNFPSIIIHKYIYSFFQKIICSTLNDKNLFISLGFNPDLIFRATLRIEQIQNRLNVKKNTLHAHQAFLNWGSFIKSANPNDAIIFGNYWPVEREIVKKNKKMITVIVPHLIQDEDFFKDHFKDQDLIIISSLSQKVEFKMNNLIIFNVKGVLVELYSFFKFAYVGGGFERSVHSLLEPFVAGRLIYTGPKIYRSSEYDIILEMAPNNIQVLKTNQAPFLEFDNPHKDVYFESFELVNKSLEFLQ